ncbi:SMP-30/gluconolactonase/LRE family protein [Ornithinibacillus salinisoli]|uniref:SMP-30/gluconolactonase/LRE family protein n=1 Tax=Ornithinibacillus salinisoli TaxID=1848459 RepID=A0ABW4W3I1_9BACI
MEGKVELVVDAKAILGEGPCWDVEQQRLYWVDIVEKKVFMFNPLTKENRSIQLEQHVGAIVPRNDQETVVALEDGFYLLNIESEEITQIHEIESHLPNNRFNDGKSDAYGRFWAGTMAKTNAMEQGALYCLETNGTVKKKVNQVSISNGIAWSSDHKYMYYIDTPTQKVVRYNFHIHTGDMEHPTDIIDFTNEVGFPDGMTIDADGMLWIAHWGGAKVSKWNSNTGEKLSVVEVPALHVTSCAFGGIDLEDLYITTAREGMDDNQLAKYPNAGGLFKVNLGVKGMPANYFKG